MLVQVVFVHELMPLDVVAMPVAYSFVELLDVVAAFAVHTFVELLGVVEMPVVRAFVVMLGVAAYFHYADRAVKTIYIR